MAIKNIRLFLNKKFNFDQPKWHSYFFVPDSHALSEYHMALDKFIYDFEGCITGWEREVDLSNYNMLSFSCKISHPNAENDLPYLYEWIERMGKSYSLCINDNIAVSGDITINVE